MTTWITVCDTCNVVQRTNRTDEDGKPHDGSVLADLIEAAATDVSDVKTRRVSCTMGCTRACNITVQAKDKINYSLGTFEPTAEDAEAIVEYASKHAASTNGQVPYREWPQGVKGHFVSRHQPLPE